MPHLNWDFLFSKGVGECVCVCVCLGVGGGGGGNQVLAELHILGQI